ncbi:MAG: MFS transporter [Defluviitaleaceae bacterium]|nr:MFS transporter [Defluviitaleaceae bacterium]
MTNSKRIPLFYITTSLYWFALYTYVPYVSPYGESLGADMRLLGLIVGAYGFMQMIVRFPLGLLSDYLGRRKVFILAGIGFASLSAFLVFFFPSPYMLLISRALGGVAASSWVAFSVMNASYYKPEETAKSVGYINASNSLGTLVALLVGGFAAQRLGVPYAFLLAGIGGLVALAMGAWVKETRIKKEEATEDQPVLKLSTNWASAFNVIRNRQLLYVSLLGVFIQFVRFASQFGFTPLAAVSLGASPFQLGLLGVLSVLPGVFISPLTGTVLLKKFGERKLLVVGFALAGLSCAMIPFSQSLWQLFAVQVIGSAGMSMVFTLLMGLCIRDVSPERRATAMGFFQAVYGLGMFLGPFVMGWMGHGFGLTAAFVAAGMVGIVGVVMVSVVRFN